MIDRLTEGEALDEEVKCFLEALTEATRCQVIKDEKAYIAKGSGFRKLDDKKIWDKVKNRKLLAYYLLEWYTNHYERHFKAITKIEIPSDLDKAIKEAKDYLHEDTMNTYDQYARRFKHETGAKRAYMCDVMLDLLREHSKYWHKCDEEHRLDYFLKLSGEKEE